MKESHSPCVVTFGGFIWIDVWLASRESRKRISLSIILVQPLFFLKSDRETGFSVNKKDVVLLFDRIFLSNILVWQWLTDWSWIDCVSAYFFVPTYYKFNYPGHSLTLVKKMKYYRKERTFQHRNSKDKKFFHSSNLTSLRGSLSSFKIFSSSKILPW